MRRPGLVSGHPARLAAAPCRAVCLANPFCYDAAMKKYVTLAILFAAMTAPLAAQDSEPDQAPGSTDTPDDIRSFEQTDTRVVDRLPKPALTPESLTPQEKALLQGAYQGNLAEVQGLVAKGASVNLADIEKRTPLILAAYNGHTPVVEFLLSEGADVNATDGSGQTALMHTCKRSFNETAAVLLKNGADANIRTRKAGTSALMIAAVLGNADLLRMLLDHGADADLTDYFGDTAKTLAEKKGNSAVVELLSDPPETAGEQN